MDGWRHLAEEALLDALALVLPVDCAGCGAEGRELCRDCRAGLASAPFAVRADGGLVVHAGAAYGDRVQRVVLALKAGRTALAGPLAVLLRAALAAAEAGPGVELCPVPSTRAALRGRGFDPVLLVLRRAGRRPARVLRAARPHRTQKGLGRAERAANLRGVHRARGRLEGRSFLLVDDVVTTGATLAEAARAIREAGGTVVGGVAIAATPLRAPAVRVRIVRSADTRDKVRGSGYGGRKGAKETTA